MYGSKHRHRFGISLDPERLESLPHLLCIKLSRQAHHLDLQPKGSQWYWVLVFLNSLWEGGIRLSYVWVTGGLTQWPRHGLSDCVAGFESCYLADDGSSFRHHHTISYTVGTTLESAGCFVTAPWLSHLAEECRATVLKHNKAKAHIIVGKWPHISEGGEG